MKPLSAENRKQPSVESGTSSSDPNLKNVVNFFFEIGMLKKTPRSGFQFLGSGKESVADHSFRMALIGYAMAHMSPGVDPCKVMCMCLFHDVPEARTGDMNYVNKRYVRVAEKEAIRDLARKLPFGGDYEALMLEYRENNTEESRLVHDADQLDLILELKEQHDLGNDYAQKWIHFALKRLQTTNGKALARQILHTDSTAWWFEGNDHWWGREDRGQPSPNPSSTDP